MTPDATADTTALGALETTAEDLARELGTVSPPLLIAVRDPDEQAGGVIDDPRLVPLTELERRAGEWTCEPGREFVLHCASDRRSAEGEQRLRRLGMRSVRSLRGGIAEWRRQGRSVEAPRQLPAAGLDARQLERYARQLRLPEIGVDGQRRLLDARVLCVGAGGLGSPACPYLAAAGVGRLGIIDDDVAVLGNLHRQILHTTDRVGLPKTESAGRTLAALNPEVRISAHRVRLSAANAFELLAGYDLLIDGSDNFATRYLVNDAALRLGMPAIFGAVLRYEGQVGIFDGAPCYRCLFPLARPAAAAPSCTEAGVLGIVPGVVGTLQAAEALAMRFTTLSVRADPQCPACGTGAVRAQLVLRDEPDACAEDPDTRESRER